MSLKIRGTTKADSALVYAFVRELAEYERLLDDVVATEADIERALFEPNPRVFCDIAEWNGSAAGFALWFYNFSTFRGRHGIYLEDLFVRPAFRGKGIGKSLLVTLAKRAAAESCARVEWSVLDWNEPSIKFYELLGALPQSKWTTFRLTGDALKKLGA
ncbi:MAG: GNAT family N-acetyltransferase [Alphaproteobacteria bacterium]|nr:GNAT family N-acetyltransferase [Alphaproteobacteria bacterium]